MKLFNSKYSQSQFWLNTLQVKEGKKQGLEVNVEPQEQNFNENPSYTQYPQTVFTQADLGHDEEEKRQIQQLYAELKALPLRYVYT